jgi:hypothetical protein
MNESRSTYKTLAHLALLSVILGGIWLLIAFGLGVYIAMANDPPGNMPVDIPKVAEQAYAFFTFPSEYVVPWQSVKHHIGGSLTIRIRMAGMFMNGVMWAIVAFCFVRWFKRFHKRGI